MAVSIWCLPQPEDAAPYGSAIETLAQAQGAPVFAPHLTLGTLAQETLPDLEALAAAASGICLDPVALQGSDVFTQSLFVQFARTPALDAARQRLEAHPSFHAAQTFTPHISLCYGPPPQDAANIADLNALLDRPVRFDRLAAVRLSLPVLTYTDVVSWQIAETVRIP